MRYWKSNYKTNEIVTNATPQPEETISDSSYEINDVGVHTLYSLQFTLQTNRYYII